MGNWQPKRSCLSRNEPGTKRKLATGTTRWCNRSTAGASEEVPGHRPFELFVQKPRNCWGSKTNRSSYGSRGRGFTLLIQEKRPVGSLPPSKPPTGPAPPRRSVCAPGTMSLHYIADQSSQGVSSMRMSSWLRSARSLFVPAGTKKAHGTMRAPLARLRVEPLEDRTVPSTFMVDNLADSGTGSLRQAVLDANANPGADLISFAPAARDGTIALNGGQLSITDDLTIDGPGADRLAVSGNNASRVFQINSGVAVNIDGLTVTHGRAVGQGGGILNAGTLTVSHAILSDNQVFGLPGASLTAVVDAFGGGIFNKGTLTVSHSTFVHNQSIGADGTPSSIGSSALGGAIMSSGTASAPATATVSYSTFLDNQAIGGAAGVGASRGGVGGAINNATGTFTVSHSVFHDNQAVGGLDNGVPGGFGAGVGGAISNVARFGSALLSVSHSTLTNNRAVGGAAGAAAIAQSGRGGAIAN